MEDSAYSSYNALQSKVEIRAWHGLTMLSSYAFAKSIDNLSADVQGYSSQDPNNNNAEKGPSDFDVRHRWVTSVNYALPFGKQGSSIFSHVVRDWELGSIFTMQSGLPFTPSISTDSANTGTSRRPNRIGTGELVTRTLSRDFDVSAFRVPVAYTYGNSGRNILYGRGFTNWDFITVRNFISRSPSSSNFAPSSSISPTHLRLARPSPIFSPPLPDRSSRPASPAMCSLH